MIKEPIAQEEHDFRRRIWVVVLVTLLLPPLTGIFMLSFVGVFPFPEVLYPFTDYAAIVVTIATFTAIYIGKSFLREMTTLTKHPEYQKHYQYKLKLLPIAYFSVLFLYFAIGLISTLYSLSSLHGFNYSYSKYITSLLGVIPGGLITALPIFFYLTDALGRYLAPHGVEVSVAPIKLKLIVLGLFIPVLIDTLLIMYFYDRTGYLAVETLGIWLFLILIAAVGTLMAWQSFRQSLSPFVLALEADQSTHHNIQIIPQSLDELGLISKRWQEVWLRTLEYEKRLSISHDTLQNDVQQRTQELESERLLIDKLLNNTTALILILDSDGRIVRFNPACEKVTGFSFSELQNQPIWEWLIAPEQLENVRQVFDNLTDAGFESQYENDLMTSDGGRVLVAWNNSTIYDETGKVQFIVSVGIDFSERQAAQAALKQAKEQAEQANLAKSEFLSRMSHELRTPLNAILGFGQLLQFNNHNDDEDQNLYVREILQAGSHLLALINDVLDIARIEEGKFEVHLENTNASKIISESLMLIMPQASKIQIEIINNISKTTDYWVKADPLRLKQVLLNLLSNAIKYNVKDGKIFIDINRPNDQQLRIYIKDTGIGIPEEMLDRLFIPFERLSHSKNTNVEGAGIGLALSKRMVELMQGSIGAECEAGKGCSFYIDLPFIEEQPHQIAEQTSGNISRNNTTGRPRYKILYVEDNPANLRLVSHAIKSRGDIELVSAHTGTLGLEMALDLLPDLILLDINLPGINGIDIVQKLKQNESTKHIPVIAISAHAMAQDIETATKKGFNAYLVKPLELDKLFEELQKYLPIKLL